MSKKNDRNPNFLTKFFWFCSGANTEVLKKVESEQGKYTNQGFAIFIIGIVGACTGGYAISTVFTSRLVIYAGGAIWGLILSSIDRSMVSGFNKTTNPSPKEQFGQVVSLIVKLGISTLISFTVAKPLELKIFESSIDARIARNIESEISKNSEPIINNYQVEIQKLEKEKQLHRKGLIEFQKQLKQREDAYQQELVEGGYGRARGYGRVARQLEQSVEQAKQQYDRQEETLRTLIQEKEEKIENLISDRQEKLSAIEKEIKEEQTATDFVARLNVLHQIQEEEDKIIWEFGVYEATGWVISLIFILIDTYPVINKIFSPIDNYEKLLEKNQKKEGDYTELVLSEESVLQQEAFKREIQLTRELEQGRFNNKKKQIPDLLEKEADLQQKKSDVQDIFNNRSLEDFKNFQAIYIQKCNDIGSDNLNNANSLAQLRQAKRDFDKTYFQFLPELSSRLEELKTNVIPKNKTNHFKSDRHYSVGYTPQEEEYKSGKKNVLSFLPFNNRKSKVEQKELSTERSRKNHAFKALGLLATPLALWVGAETLVVSRTKIDPIPYPQEASSHVVYTSDEKEIRDPKSWKTSSRELELEDFSPTLKQALIASEDRRFYQHNGFDSRGTLRALARTMTGNKQGGSTITQQVAKKLFIEQQQQNLLPLRKKLQQIILAIRLENNYDKDEILKTYLNRIYLGHQKGRALIGFEEAAQFYFGKSAQNLDISESATLVGMLPSPSTSNPIQNLELAKKMRDSRIQQMLDLGKITVQEAEKAFESEIEIKNQFSNYPDTLAPYAHDRVQRELTKVLDENLASGQLVIETTINNDYQLAAEQTLKTKLQTQGTQKGYQEGALVTIDSQTGAILAFVGGTGVNYPINYASDVKPPLASTFKLIPYTIAIAKGFSPNDTLSCFPWQGGDKYTIPACRQGDNDMTLLESLANSENPPALRLADEVGLEPIENLSTELGLDLDLENLKDSKGYHQQLTLGTYGATVLNITNAYATIANNGIFNQPHIIKTIRDRNNCENPQQLNSCKVIYSVSDRPQGKAVVSPQVAQEVNTMLKEVVTNGTATQALNSNAPEFIADLSTFGKTGTSKDSQDLWFIGSVPEKNLTTGVWLGTSCVDEPIRQKFCNSPKGESSLSVALWAKYMKRVVR